MMFFLLSRLCKNLTSCIGKVPLDYSHISSELLESNSIISYIVISWLRLILTLDMTEKMDIKNQPCSNKYMSEVIWCPNSPRNIKLFFVQVQK